MRALKWELSTGSDKAVSLCVSTSNTLQIYSPSGEKQILTI